MKIIAEFCQNHNGNFDVLKKMIAAAAEGGATHGKIQTIFASDVSFRPQFEEGKVDESGRTLVIKRPYQSEYDRLKKLELTYDQHEQFIEECRKVGLVPLTTAFNRGCIARLKNFGWKTIKVASYDCGSLPLIKELAQNFDELLISTGASYDTEIEATASVLKEEHKKFTFLHCVTIYPTPLEMMNLARLKYLQKFSTEVGFSDHSLVSRDGVKATLAAIFLGASVIERHFTILPEGETRDGKVSITKDHLRQINNFVKLGKSEREAYIQENVPEFSSMIGQEKRTLTHDEELNRAYYRGRFCDKEGDRQIFNWETKTKIEVVHDHQ